VVQVPVDRHSFALFPPLHGADVAPQVGRDLFPGIEPILRRACDRGHVHACVRIVQGAILLLRFKRASFLCTPTGAQRLTTFDGIPRTKELLPRFTACQEPGVASIVEVTDKTAALQKETPACFTPPLYLGATHTTPRNRSNSKRHGAMQRGRGTCMGGIASASQ